MKKIILLFLLLSVSLFASNKTIDGFPNYENKECLKMNRELLKSSRELDNLEFGKEFLWTMEHMEAVHYFMAKDCYNDKNLDDENRNLLKDSHARLKKLIKKSKEKLGIDDD